MTTFADLDLNPKVQKAITEAGYETPTPIQAGAIPPALQGRDVLGIAQTGTGKTASFTLPMITMLARGRARARMPRSLVLCPTRELAAQVAENFDIYAKNVKLTKALLIGGVSFKEQEAAIDKGVDVLIATPGRLLDHFERGKLILNDVKVMVVDEADRMLDMGFIPDIERIFGLVPFTRQTLFFSATMAPEIERITNTFLSNPEKIEVERQSTTSDTIEQRLIEFKAPRRDAQAKMKRDMLRAAITAEGDAFRNAIIFCNRKVDVDIVAKSLKKHGLNAEPIHGDLDQSHRMRTLAGFRDGSITFLVASDVAARGLDIPNVSHVFNYDVPSHAEDYVHRIGRTGRAGKTGVAITLCVPSDEKYLAAIESLIKQPIPRAEAPIDVKSAPAAKSSDEEKPKRSRRGGRRSEEPKAEQAAETPKAEQPKAEAAPEAKPEPQERQPQQQPRRERSERGGKGRGRDRGDRGSRVVGMGEFTPDFIGLSFDERRGGPAREMNLDEDETPTDAPAEDAPQPDAQTEAPAEKPKRRRSRKPKVEAETPADETVAEAEAPQTDAEAAPEDKAEAAPEEKPKRRRARKPKADAEAAPNAEAAAPEAEAETEEKPKRRRTRKKKVEEETPETPAAEDTPASE
ncbi:DEAD/DEAH box helicase [Gymnodinialimonas ceratoperidinii]|uniref:DEAD-box ATP-dependent RNA helicase RhpA n=1 Tax=Gymnodinialimonas ceratoperidinii TaxID=2856823 RepID=A0A8F6TUY9_9RHOB|nr:DEAD/DEAH box helicase [Gymnodinialimonas ceratoperidinii]QXT39165.1 DEAD/DEAH box helicase [Gymnodinialimonas ceratoperidinii]